jgi:hypothetical protein
VFGYGFNAIVAPRIALALETAAAESNVAAEAEAAVEAVETTPQTWQDAEQYLNGNGCNGNSKIQDRISRS